MWQRFSENARRAVFYAQEEAQKYGEGYVSTEHLLLGLCRMPDCAGSQVIVACGITIREVIEEVRNQLPRGEARQSQDMTLTPRAKRVIDLAYDGARNLGNSWIGTEHLLLGLVREGDGLAGRVLAKLKIRHERVLEVVQAVQSEKPVPPPAPDPPYPEPEAKLAPARWGDLMSYAFLANHRNTRSAIVALACLKDSEKLRKAMEARGINAEVIGHRAQTELFQRALIDDWREPLLSEVFRIAMKMAGPVGAEDLDPGFVFLADLEADERMRAAAELLDEQRQVLQSALISACRAE